jgi:hypothetical protein
MSKRGEEKIIGYTFLLGRTLIRYFATPLRISVTNYATTTYGNLYAFAMFLRRK